VDPEYQRPSALLEEECSDQSPIGVVVVVVDEEELRYLTF
jgi:hypothetical protein